MTLAEMITLMKTSVIKVRAIGRICAKLSAAPTVSAIMQTATSLTTWSVGIRSGSTRSSTCGPATMPAIRYAVRCGRPKRCSTFELK